MLLRGNSLRLVLVRWFAFSADGSSSPLASRNERSPNWPPASTKSSTQLFSGNTTVIIGGRQVFVVDTCYLPSEARQDIAQIRQWTDRPVSFVLNTHFHNDHNLGNRAYMDAFPALTIIAHVETKREMDLFGPGSASRDEKDVARLQRMLDTGKTPSGQVLTEADKAQV